jgi:tRNA/rRNA methyltransferase
LTSVERSKREILSQLNSTIFDHFIVVLHRPSKVINIGGVVRVLKNMGFCRLRLVAPVAFEVADITGIAHRSEDILATLQTFDDLDAALADVRHVVGTTSRCRSEQHVRSDIRPLVAALVSHAQAGPVALLFGSEDTGLNNAALDRCHTILCLPTDSSYPSLNLSHAVLLLTYEIRLALLETVSSIPSDSHRTQHLAATTAQRTMLVENVEHALQAVEFFKTGQTEHIKRMVWSVINRADVSEEEA